MLIATEGFFINDNLFLSKIIYCTLNYRVETTDGR